MTRKNQRERRRYAANKERINRRRRARYRQRKGIVEEKLETHPILGDDLFRAFREWAGEGIYNARGEVLLRSFVNWLSDTLAGDQALRRIQTHPGRQQFLPFPDEAVL